MTYLARSTERTPALEEMIETRIPIGTHLLDRRGGYGTVGIGQVNYESVVDSGEVSMSLRQPQRVRVRDAPAEVPAILSVRSRCELGNLAPGEELDYFFPSSSFHMVRLVDEKATGTSPRDVNAPPPSMR